LYKSFGLSGLKFYFISNNIGRITGELAGSSTDSIFYLHTFLWAFLPWTPVVVLALVKMAKTRLAGFDNKNFVIGLIGSVLVLLLILSIAKGKAPNYFLITVAPFSVFAGWWLAGFMQAEQKKQRQVYRFYVAFAGLYTLFFAFVVWFLGNRTLVLPFTVLFISGLCLLAVAKSKELRFSALIAFLVLITAGLNLFLNYRVFPDLATFQGGRQVVNLFDKNKKPGDRLYSFELDDYNLYFYSTDKTENIENWEELYETMEKPGSWIYTNDIKYNDIMAMEYSIDTVYCIKQRGMNQINLEYLNPATREAALITNYVIVSGGKKLN
jgi:general stress protein CsbA